MVSVSVLWRLSVVLGVKVYFVLKISSAVMSVWISTCERNFTHPYT